MIFLISTAGGLFAFFTFVHFVVDWVFQTHHEAMNKHNRPWIRAKHCVIYTLPFIPLLWLFDVEIWLIIICGLVLFFSHFIEDTYIPVYLWAKYIRKIPGIQTKHDFKDFVGTSSLGKILMIAIDQIIHLSFLWVLVIAVMI